MADEIKNDGGQPTGGTPKQEPVTPPVEANAAPAESTTSPVETASTATPAEQPQAPAADSAAAKVVESVSADKVVPPVVQTGTGSPSEPVVKKYTIQEAHADKFGHFNGVQDEVGGTLEKVTKARGAFEEKLKNLRAHDEVMKVTVRVNGSDKIVDKTFDQLMAEVEEAHGKYLDKVKRDENNNLVRETSGKKDYVISKEFMDEYKTEAEARAAFGQLDTDVQNARKALDGAIAKSESTVAKEFVEAQKNAAKFGSMVSGNLHARGLGGTLKDNFDLKREGAFKRVGIRSASTAFGGYLMLDAARSKTSDGQDRSWVTRVGEGAIGAAAVFGGLVGGKARL